jgi:hypothetical protein
MLLEEYKRTVAGMDEPIRARIYRNDEQPFDSPFRFEIYFSHWFQPTAGAAGVWRANFDAPTLKEARGGAQYYLSNFTAEFGVETNPNFT